LFYFNKLFSIFAAKQCAMHIEEIRHYCLAKPAVTEGLPFGDDTLVFKVAGKMFLLANLEGPLSVNIKATPEDVAERLANHHEVIPAYHMNKRHWITVELFHDNDRTKVLSWIDQSYSLVVSGLPKKVRQEFGLEA
jgi:predicted DNA-binding protein (MmcQ/YjbR family)